IRVLFEHGRSRDALALMLAAMNAATSFENDLAIAEVSRLDIRTAPDVFRDRSIAPSSQWDYLASLSDEQCVNLHARVFGSQDWEKVVDLARGALARFPAEREELDFIAR